MIKTKALEEVIKMYESELHPDSRTIEAKAELAAISGRDMVLVSRRNLKDIEWAARGIGRNMGGHSCAICPACEAELTFAEQHKPECWLDKVLKGK